MRLIYAVTILVSIILIPANEAADTYNVDCLDNTTAIIKLDIHHYKLSPPENCTRITQKGGEFTTTCLNNYHFLVSPVLTNNLIRGGKGSTAFSVTCTTQPSDNGTMVVLKANVKVYEDVHNYKFGAPLTGIRLLITDQNPSTASDPVNQMMTPAIIGQKLYLVIQSDESIGDDYFLPIHCTAKGNELRSALTAELWSENTTNCIQEINVLEKFVVYTHGRKYRSSSDNYNVAYAPMYAIFLNQNEVETITYSCQVMVCPNNAPATSPCGRKKTGMSNRECIREDSSPSSRRRRRAVDESAATRTEILSATLTLKPKDKTGTKLPMIPIVAGVVGGAVLLVVVAVVVMWRRVASVRRRDKKDVEMETKK